MASADWNIESSTVILADKNNLFIYAFLVETTL
jgi:hypothetical protein